MSVFTSIALVLSLTIHCTINGHSNRHNTSFDHSDWNDDYDIDSQSESFETDAESLSKRNETNRQTWTKCTELKESKSDITTQIAVSKFNFTRQKHFWDDSSDMEYYRSKNLGLRPSLRIFITPFSHNDPLRDDLKQSTDDQFDALDLIIDRMQKYTTMTFVWAEISILQKWWERANSTQQEDFRALMNSGRFEIVTGGWVMTDEANVHLYAMVNELIEGHQWLKENLNYIPISGFSIDTFGHGSTLPYLLAASGFKGTIIQRIHYGWKQYFAQHRNGDFYWQPYWNARNANSRSLLAHNLPFDTYSLIDSCGPQQEICMNFDFQDRGNLTKFITDENIEANADLLVDQYGKVASLFKHNIAIVPLGGDSYYKRDIDIDLQYSNYKRLIDYINDNPERYDYTEISFGLPIDYFAEISVRHTNFPHLKGDFFVYSDIQNEGKAAYWSGYFTTRPMFKMLGRELEHNLRSAEILFTIGLNRARQHHNTNALRFCEVNYPNLILARRNLAEFQHHKAITGVSTAAAMKAYGQQLSKSIRDTVEIQKRAIETLMRTNINSTDKYPAIVSESRRQSYDRIPRKTPILLQSDESVKVVLFNSLAQQRLEVISLHTRSLNMKVFDKNGSEVTIQINPIWKHTNSSYDWRTENLFELIFVANLPPLGMTTYTVKYSRRPQPMAKIHCNGCEKKDLDTKLFNINTFNGGNVKIKSSRLQLTFDGVTGLLKTITPKINGQKFQCNLKFGTYTTRPHENGAFLFRTNGSNSEQGILNDFSKNRLIFVTSGSIASEVTIVYGNLITQTIRVFQTGTSLDYAIHIRNDINFEALPRTQDTEMFMRFVTNITNGIQSSMYSDQNGFQYHRREKLDNLAIEANYYPITTAAFIQDDKFRLTLLTSHAQGAASLQTGFLEVMLDRRTLYSDNRGMDEGINDSQLKQQQFWLILEQVNLNASDSVEDTAKQSDVDYEILSQFSNQLSNSLNYPVHLFYVANPKQVKPLKIHEQVTLLKMRFPCDVHLMNLRTQTQHESFEFPSQRALFVLQRQTASCKIRDVVDLCQHQNGFESEGIDLFQNVVLDRVYRASLTGIYQYSRVTQFDLMFIEPMDIATFNLTFV